MDEEFESSEFDDETSALHGSAADGSPSHKLSDVFHGFVGGMAGGILRSTSRRPLRLDFAGRMPTEDRGDSMAL